MAKTRKKHWLFPAILLFVVYFFIAAQPIPKENILLPRWLVSLDSGYPIGLGNHRQAGAVIPFKLGNRFGYVDDSGRFMLNRIQQKACLSFSPYCWAEYDAVPSDIEVFDPNGWPLMIINKPAGYPFFLDNHIYLEGNEQNSISRLDEKGGTSWTYDFPAPLTCVDAASGYVITGSLDGAVELLNDDGQSVFSFEPGGSRLAVILGCAISKDKSKIAVISGIDKQRFLFMEQSGDTYRVVYHEFLDTGFRRAVHICFIDNDTKIAYEREGGIGIYDIASRTSVNASLEGEIITMGCTENNYLFAVTGTASNQKRLYGIRMPGVVVLDAPFRSDNTFLCGKGPVIYVGGDKSIISFELDKK
ncbi:MAG: WD40 repeat domain-containing protein [Treponema sp.]|nr:WD40 repeat domain-containing protein [Treponema sp.]